MRLSALCYLKVTLYADTKDTVLTATCQSFVGLGDSTNSQLPIYSVGEALP